MTCYSMHTAPSIKREIFYWRMLLTAKACSGHLRRLLCHDALKYVSRTSSHILSNLLCLFLLSWWSWRWLWCYSPKSFSRNRWMSKASGPATGDDVIDDVRAAQKAQGCNSHKPGKQCKPLVCCSLKRSSRWCNPTLGAGCACWTCSGASGPDCDRLVELHDGWKGWGCGWTTPIAMQCSQTQLNHVFISLFFRPRDVTLPHTASYRRDTSMATALPLNSLSTHLLITSKQSATRGFI